MLDIMLDLPCAIITPGSTATSKVDNSNFIAVGNSKFPLQHHFFGDARFVMAEGSELRGSYTREPLPEPYSVVVNGTFFNDPSSRQGLADIDNRMIVSSDLNHLILKAICMLS